MIKLFSKGASLLVQIILVIAAVLLFAWFDPFDFLSPTKNTLKNTPIQVQSIQEIGKLITAEYYGEVIASLDEVIEKENTDTVASFDSTIKYIHEEFISSIDSIKLSNKKNWNDNALVEFEKNCYDLCHEELYEPYLYYIFEKIKDKNYTARDLNKTLSYSQKAKLFRKLYNENSQWYAEFSAINSDKLISVFKKETVKKSLREYKKSKLVLIGRGWIKAGFNFETFSEKNFRYHKDRNKIYFIGLKPEILSKTINPWFIPEEGVEGFEFVIAEKGGLKNPEYTYKVKKRCLEKLEAQAMKKQILTTAKKNAEKNLKTFFELILNTELKGVTFHTNYLSYTSDALLNDTLKNNDLFAIDSSLYYYFRNYMNNTIVEDTNLYNFIDTLKSLPFEIFDHNYSLDSRTSLFYEVIEDFKIDTFDYSKIKTISQVTVLDSLWYLEDYFNKSDSIRNLVKKDSIQFFQNMHKFLSYRDSSHHFNDTVLQNLRAVKKDSLFIKLERIFNKNVY